MCSYPCFGLSKTGFTPPSQLLKLVIFLKKTKTALLPMQKSAAKTTSLPIKKSAAKTASLQMQKSAMKTVSLPMSLPMQKSAAKTESSILSIYIFFSFFLLGVYSFLPMLLEIIPLLKFLSKISLTPTPLSNSFRPRVGS